MGFSVKPSERRVAGSFRNHSTFSCLYRVSGFGNLRSYYTQLTERLRIASAGLEDQAEPPFGGDLLNQGYRSSSGAHLEVWIARAASGTIYEIHFQLVSAH